MIEEVFVTATRRTGVTVQDVPASVGVLSETLLDNADVNTMGDIEQLDPTVQITQTESAAAGTIASIRGIGTASNNPGFEPSVGVLIDGVFRTRTGVALAELPELASIEVLRGPQGTLFGRNTSAGAISINTAFPEEEVSGDVMLQAGNFDLRSLRGNLSLPLGDDWGARIDVSHRERGGLFEEVNSERELNAIDRTLARAQVLYRGERASLRVIGDVGATDEPCCVAVVTDQGNTGPAVAALAAARSAAGFASQSLDDFSVALSPARPTEETIDEWGLSAQYDYRIGAMTFSSISAYRDWEALRDQDVDGTGMDRSYRDDYRVADATFTQELRLQGVNGRLDWLIGAYYLHQDLKLRDTLRAGADGNTYTDLLVNATTRSPELPAGLQVFGTLPGVPSVLAALNPGLASTYLPGTTAGDGQQADQFELSTEALAWFSHNEISLSDALMLTAGVRYTYESKNITANLESRSPPCDFLNANLGLAQLLGTAATLVCSPAVNSEGNLSDTGKRDDGELSGTLRLSYDLDEDWLVFAGISRGFKSGGFNLARSAFDYSIGGGSGPSLEDLEFDEEVIKSADIGFNSVLMNGRLTLNAAAYFQDIDGYQIVVFNGSNFVTFNAPAESYGFEVDLLTVLAPGLTLQVGGAYNIVELTEDIAAGSVFIAGDEQLPRSPESTVTTALTYFRPLGTGLALNAHLNARYTSRHSLAQAGPAAELEQDPFTLLNGRLGIGSIDEGWQLVLFGANLLDKDYGVQSFALAEQTGIGVYPGAPRSYGVEVRLAW